jgi:hypothetical protein
VIAGFTHLLTLEGMSEFQQPGGQEHASERSEHCETIVGNALRIAALRRYEDTARGGHVVAHEFLNLLDSFERDSDASPILTVVMGATPSGKLIWDVSLADAPEGAEDNLALAAEIVCDLKVKCNRKLQIPLEHCLEVLPTDAHSESLERYLPPLTVSSSDFEPGEIPIAWAVPIQLSEVSPSFLADVIVRGKGQVAIVTKMAAASDLEKTEVASTLELQRSVQERLARRAVGASVRIRTWICASKATALRNVEREFRNRASGLSMEPRTPGQARAFLHSTALDLAGYARDHITATALLPVPVGNRHTFPGLPMQSRAPQNRPLDLFPVPSPSNADVASVVTCTGQRRRLQITPATMTMHTQILGGTGRGKSTAEAQYALAAFRAGWDVWVVDPHSQLAATIMAHAHSEDVMRTALYSFGDLNRMPSLNPWNCDGRDFEQALDDFVELLGQIQDPGRTGMVGARAKTGIKLVFRACRALQEHNASLGLVLQLLGDVQRMRQLADRVKAIDSDLARRIITEFCSGKSDEMADLQSWLASKLRSMFDAPALQVCLGSGRNDVTLDYNSDQNQMLLFDLAMPSNGDMSVRMFGLLLLMQFHRAVLRRRRKCRPLLIVIDEAHMFKDGPLPELLDQCRKFNVGLVVAHQRNRQLEAIRGDNSLADALKANVGTFISFGCGPDDARECSVRLDDWPVESLVKLPVFNAAARTIVGGTPTDPFTAVFDLYKRSKGVSEEELGVRMEQASSRVWDNGGHPASAADIITPEKVTELLRGGRIGDEGRSSRHARSSGTVGSLFSQADGDGGTPGASFPSTATARTAPASISTSSLQPTPHAPSASPVDMAETKQEEFLRRAKQAMDERIQRGSGISE